MPRKKTHQVNLSSEEKSHLQNILSAGEHKSRVLTRARILLKADEDWTDKAVELALNVTRPTIERTRKRFAELGFSQAVYGKVAERHFEKLIDGRTEAHLIALVCGDPPSGYAKWTLRLLSNHLVALEGVEIESVSHETIRQTLKKMNLSLGRTNLG